MLYVCVYKEDLIWSVYMGGAYGYCWIILKNCIEFTLTMPVIIITTTFQGILSYFLGVACIFLGYLALHLYL